MIILGIDPGLALTGWGAVLHSNSRLRYVGHGVLETKAGIPLPQRLLDLSGQLERLLGRLKPESVAVEELFFAKNAKTAIAVAHARGVIVATIARRHIPVREFTPLEIKLAVTSSGRAQKHQVKLMVKRLLNLKALSGPDDACDALATAICAANTIVMG